MSEELIAAFDIRGTEEMGLTTECAWNVGKALAEWLPTSGQVGVAYLPSHSNTAKAAIEGLCLQGRPVIDLGAMDRDTLRAYIAEQQLSGALLVGFDELENMITVELYQHEGKLVDSESGLHAIRALVEAGNFVPAVTKGEVTALA